MTRLVDPKGPSTGSNRVVRGGSWFYEAQYLRSAYRLFVDPGSRYDFVGFRLVRTPVSLGSVTLLSLAEEAEALFKEMGESAKRDEAISLLKQVLKLLEKL
jgi:sulfatase-modifying factor enzyme 1